MALNPFNFPAFRVHFTESVRQLPMSALKLVLVLMTQCSSPEDIRIANEFFSRQAVMDWFGHPNNDALYSFVPSTNVGYSRMVDFWLHQARSSREVQNCAEIIHCFQELWMHIGNIIPMDSSLYDYDIILGWRLTRLWGHECSIEDYLEKLVFSQERAWKEFKRTLSFDPCAELMTIHGELKVVHAVGSLRDNFTLPHAHSKSSAFICGSVYSNYEDEAEFKSQCAYSRNSPLFRGQIAGIFRQGDKLSAGTFARHAVDCGIVAATDVSIAGGDGNNVSIAHNQVISVHSARAPCQNEVWSCVTEGNVSYCNSRTIPKDAIILGRIVHGNIAGDVGTTWIRVSPPILTDAAMVLLGTGQCENQNRWGIIEQIRCLEVQMISRLTEVRPHDHPDSAPNVLVVGKYLSGKSTLINSLCRVEVAPTRESISAITDSCNRYYCDLLNCWLIDTPGFVPAGDDDDWRQNERILSGIQGYIQAFGLGIRRIFVVSVQRNILEEAKFMGALLRKLLGSSMVPSVTFFDTDTRDKSRDDIISLQTNSYVPMVYVQHNLFNVQMRLYQKANDCVLLSSIADP